jgi:hypothetical protein
MGVNPDRFQLTITLFLRLLRMIVFVLSPLLGSINTSALTSALTFGEISSEWFVALLEICGIIKILTSESWASIDCLFFLRYDPKERDKGLFFYFK